MSDGRTDVLADVLAEDPRLVAMGMSAIEWMPDDRLLYARTASRDGPAELRALADASTASSTDGSTVVRTWEDYALIRLTRGTERLVASRGTAVQDIWSLDAADPSTLELLTREEWSDRPLGWDLDGVVFTSNRGSGGLFVLDPEVPGPPTRIAATDGLGLRAYAVDGALLVGGFARSPETEPPRRAVFQVTRLADGERTPLHTQELTESIGSATPAHSLGCSAGRCLVSAPDGDEVVFRWLDPEDGGLSEPVASLSIGARSVAWALSPDARRIVALVADPAQRIEVDLQTGEHDVVESELDLPLSLAWMPDGSALYASGLSLESVDVYRMGVLHDDGRHEVLHASMNTNFHTLVPAPDSSGLVLGSHSFGSDLWLLSE